MQIIDDRRALHQIPELDRHLPKTMDYLKNLEIDPTAHIAPSATMIGDVKVGAECTV